jgi:3-hydroxypropanoate dehydrogenase
MRHDKLSDETVRTLFTDARTHNAWLDRPVPDTLLREVAELMKLGPTSANSSPARLLFVRSPEAKARLKPHLSAGNVDKTMAAPATVIVAMDYAFYEKMPQLFPHNPGSVDWFKGKPAVIEENALRNSSLQGAYLILAARTLGLDCGPMGGFDRKGVDAEFFSGTEIRSNFLCNLGYGDDTALKPRLPRLAFEEYASII